MEINGKPNVKVQIEKPRRRKLRVGDPDFQAPDGGWGWFVLLACGFSNLSTFPMLQQFGLVFREKFEALGMTNPETTTIINMNSAATACVGLLNGPVFKRYSFRQYALFGSFLASISLFLTAFSDSFWAYMFLYAIGYGAALGITQSSNALALNTYFKTKRRTATGLSWTTTAIGPIVCPYIITFLIGVYGVEGTLMIFAAFSTHAIFCALMLQPVHWHTKFRESEPTKPLTSNGDESGYLSKRSKSRSLFSSQFLMSREDRFSAVFDVVDCGTPMMIRANDGWQSHKSSLVGSRISLSSSRGRSRLASGQNSVTMSKRPSYGNLAEARKKKSQSRPAIQEHDAEDCPLEKAPQDLKKEDKLLLTDVAEPTYPNEKDVLKTAAKRLARYKETTEIHEYEMTKMLQEESKLDDNKKVPEDEQPQSYTFFQKVAIFFDLNLFKDYIYVNLMLGITIANFAELNFSILTPFVLKEFNFGKYEIATFMSLLGAIDILVRFLSSFLADKIGWQNKSFFLLGVLCMAVGRIILVHTQTYQISLLVAVVIGFGKGLRTVFMALVIPSHVPLEKLPAASGLQLVTSGILFLVMGPVIGWIRDAVNNYVITLHLLNICTYVTAVAWMAEMVIMSRKKKDDNSNITKS